MFSQAVIVACSLCSYTVAFQDQHTIPKRNILSHSCYCGLLSLLIYSGLSGPAHHPRNEVVVWFSLHRVKVCPYNGIIRCCGHCLTAARWKWTSLEWIFCLLTGFFISFWAAAVIIIIIFIILFCLIRCCGCSLTAVRWKWTQINFYKVNQRLNIISCNTKHQRIESNINNW